MRSAKCGERGVTDCDTGEERGEQRSQMVSVAGDEGVSAEIYGLVE